MDGKYRMLNVIDEFTHECLAIRVARKLKATDVIDVLSDLFILRGVPGHIRSDNGGEALGGGGRGRPGASSALPGRGGGGKRGGEISARQHGLAR